MRTLVILSAGLLLFGAMFLYSRLFTNYFPGSVTTATYAFVAIWLGATAFNMWVGVSQAGYSVREELPIMLLLFSLPTAVALLVRWKLG